MKVSGFTFIRNGRKLGYPFVESIRSILPIVDEYVIALGTSDDGTEEALRGLNDPKIRIIPTVWNEVIRSDYSIKGFVYGQQKSIALFNCTGDWAFYLEADEVVHENDLPKVHAEMERRLGDERVEALAFDYLHFYGNRNTYAWSPGWYRTEVRIIRNTIPAWASEGLFFNVVRTHKSARYPRAAHTGVKLYHYGWVKTEEQMNLKKSSVSKFWRSSAPKLVEYAEIDPRVLRRFSGTHPRVMEEWLPPAEGLFEVNLRHRLSTRERKHRWMLQLEKLLGIQFRKKHYTLVK